MKLIFAVFAILIATGPAWAEAVPPGSYQRSCRDIDASSNTLWATCRTPSGRWRDTSLDNYGDCDGDIINNNGQLECQRDWRDDEDDFPPGSYQRTCRDEHVERGTLTAECQDRNGRWRYTELNGFRTCRGDIANNDGMLQCRREQRFNHGPGRIVLYKNTNFGGRSRTYASDIPNLNPDEFGNTVSSVVVQGGVWQLCDRPNYRGFCVTIDRSQTNLWAFGFNDRTESVRRIR